MLWLYRRVDLRRADQGHAARASAICARNEVIAFAPLIVLVIVMGVYPSLFLDPMHASVEPAAGADRGRGHRSRPALSAETSTREPRPHPRRLRAGPVRRARWRCSCSAAVRGEQDGARLLTPAGRARHAGRRRWSRSRTTRRRDLAFDGHFVFDGFAAFLKVLILLGAAGALLLGRAVPARREDRALRVPAAGRCSRPSACA